MRQIKKWDDILQDPDFQARSDAEKAQIAQDYQQAQGKAEPVLREWEDVAGDLDFRSMNSAEQEGVRRDYIRGARKAGMNLKETIPQVYGEPARQTGDVGFFDPLAILDISPKPITSALSQVGQAGLQVGQTGLQKLGRVARELDVPALQAIGRTIAEMGAPILGAMPGVPMSGRLPITEKQFTEGVIRKDPRPFLELLEAAKLFEPGELPPTTKEEAIRSLAEWYGIGKAPGVAAKLFPALGKPPGQTWQAIKNRWALRGFKEEAKQVGMKPTDYIGWLNKIGQKEPTFTARPEMAPLEVAPAKTAPPNIFDIVRDMQRVEVAPPTQPPGLRPPTMQEIADLAEFLKTPPAGKVLKGQPKATLALEKAPAEAPKVEVGAAKAVKGEVLSEKAVEALEHLKSAPQKTSSEKYVRDRWGDDVYEELYQGKFITGTPQPSPSKRVMSTLNKGREYLQTKAVKGKAAPQTLAEEVLGEGGIRSYKDGFLAEELQEIPLRYRNNKTGKTVDEMTDIVIRRGWLPEGSSDDALIDALKGKAKPLKQQLKEHEARQAEEAIHAEGVELGRRMAREEARLIEPEKAEVYTENQKKAFAYQRKLREEREAAELPVGGREQRLALQEQKRVDADRLRTEVLKEISESQPVGKMSDIGEVLGVRADPKHEMTSTPIGTLVYRKGKLPSLSKLKEWEQKYKEAERLDQESIGYGFMTIEPGRTIGNKRVLEQGQRLRQQGLLSPEENSYVSKLEDFWNRYPDARGGVVRPNGTIEPLELPGRAGSEIQRTLTGEERIIPGAKAEVTPEGQEKLFGQKAQPLLVEPGKVSKVEQPTKVLPTERQVQTELAAKAPKVEAGQPIVQGQVGKNITVVVEPFPSTHPFKTATLQGKIIQVRREPKYPRGWEAVYTVETPYGEVRVSHANWSAKKPAFPRTGFRREVAYSELIEKKPPAEPPKVEAAVPEPAVTLRPDQTLLPAKPGPRTFESLREAEEHLARLRTDFNKLNELSLEYPGDAGINRRMGEFIKNIEATEKVVKRAEAIEKSKGPLTAQDMKDATQQVIKRVQFGDYLKSMVMSGKATVADASHAINEAVAQGHITVKEAQGFWHKLKLPGKFGSQSGSATIVPEATLEPLGVKEGGFVGGGKPSAIPGLEAEVLKKKVKDFGLVDMAALPQHVADRHPWVKPLVDKGIEATARAEAQSQASITRAVQALAKVEKPSVVERLLGQKRGTRITNLGEMVEGKAPVPENLRPVVEEFKGIYEGYRTRVIKWKQDMVRQHLQSDAQREYLSFLEGKAEEPVRMRFGKEGKADKRTIAAAQEALEQIKEISNWGKTDYFPRVWRGPFMVRLKGQEGIIASGATEKQALGHLKRQMEVQPELKGKTFVLSNEAPDLEYLGARLSRKEFFSLTNRIDKEVQAKVNSLQDEMAISRKDAHIELKGIARPRPGGKYAPHLMERKTELVSGEADPFRATVSYIISMERKLNLDPFLQYAQKFRESIPGDMPWAKKWVDMHTENVRGRYDILDQVADKLLGGRLAPFALSRGVGTAMGLEAKAKLGWAPMKAAVNRIGGFYHTFVKTSLGSRIKGRRLMKSDPELATWFAEDAPIVGISDPSASFMTRGAYEPKPVSVARPLGLYSGVEPLNRKEAYGAFFAHTLRQGATREAARKAAIEGTQLTQIIYNVGNLPVWVRGPAVRQAYQFKQFLMGEIRFMASLTPGQWAKYLPGLTAMAGIRGVSLTLKSLPPLALFNYVSGNQFEKLEKFLADKAQDNWVYRATHYGLAGLAYIDISAPASWALPTQARDFFGPVANDVSKFLRTFVEGMRKGGLTKQDINELFGQLAPVGANIAKGIEILQRGATTAGGKLIRKAKGYEGLINILLGARTTEQAREATEAQALRQTEELRRVRARLLKDKYFAAKEAGDFEKAEEIRKELLEKYGVTGKGLLQSKRERKKTRLERLERRVPRALRH